jgi:hypothetical protein
MFTSTRIQGQFKVSDFKHNTIMNVDTSTKITCFNTVGINQSAFEVNAILDIDTNSQEQITLINKTIKASLRTLYLKLKHITIDEIDTTQFSDMLLFSIPFKDSILKSDIQMIHGSLNLDEPSLFKFRNIIHELNYITKSTQIYTFVEIINDTTSNYLFVMSGIIKENSMIFFVIPSNVDTIMNDSSLSPRFNNVINEYSLLNKSLNYAVTLLEDPEIKSDILLGKVVRFINSMKRKGRLQRLHNLL